MRSPLIPTAGLAAILFAVVPGAAQTSLTVIPTLAGGVDQTRGNDVSEDGSVVSGRTNSANGGEAYRWTSAGSTQPIGDLPGGSYFSTSHGISGDGSVVVGHSISGTFREAYRWTFAGGMVGLGDLVGVGDPESFAFDVSEDGSVVVGWAASTLGLAGEEAYRWTSGGMVGLGGLTGDFRRSSALGTSADGAVVVGSSTRGFFPNEETEGWRWTQATGLVGLGDFAGGAINSIAKNVSANGSIVVGSGESALGLEAFRWTLAGGTLTSLGDLPGGAYSADARAVSNDGNIVVGTSSSANGSEAFVWDPEKGMRALQDVLEDDFGVDLTGWTILSNAQDVSGDGRHIAGWGQYQGSELGFVATLDTPCNDGDDDDSDGLIDYPDDPGCLGPLGLSELPDCNDGLDNDGDGSFDYPDDPGCRNLQEGFREDPECDDGADNDGDGDIDLADAQCSAAWDDREAGGGGGRCGLGFELAFLIPLLMRLRRGPLFEGAPRVLEDQRDPSVVGKRRRCAL
jgi:probable HAF family extracellular repeat protein